MTKRKMGTFKPKYEYLRQPIKVDSPYMTISFGKHKGETYQDILQSDPSYILWLHDQKLCIFPEDTLEIAEIAARRPKYIDYGGFTDMNTLDETFGYSDLPF